MRTDLRFDLELTTPGFVGGPNQNASIEDGIRPSVVKSTMRFWWRVLNFSNAGDGQLYEREMSLFGAMPNEHLAAAGQGFRLIPVRVGNAGRILSRDRLNGYPPEVKYMYFGTPELSSGRKKQINRDALGEGWRNSFRILDGRDVRGELTDALFLLSQLGGVGNRSRRCWGSLTGRVPADAGAPENAPRLQDLAPLLRKRPTNAVEAIYEFTPPAGDANADGWMESVKLATLIMKSLRTELAALSKDNLYLLGHPQMSANIDPTQKEYDRVASRLIFHVRKTGEKGAAGHSLVLTLLKKEFALPQLSRNNNPPRAELLGEHLKRQAEQRGAHVVYPPPAAR